MAQRTTNTDTTGRTVIGLFHNRDDAEAAINDLKSSGFTEDQIGVAMRDRTQQGDLIDETGTKVAEGATTGAVSGGVVGGVVGFLAGVGALAIPGIGPIVAAGWLGSTLAGAGIGAAAGGLVGALVGMGIPEEDAQHFEAGFKSGGILVTVNAGTRTGEALAILGEHDADLGPSRGRFDSTERSATGRDAMAAGTGRAHREIDEEDEGRMRLREEQLDVSKEKVKAGEARLRKEVTSEEKSIDVPVTREELVIERRPASGREVSDTDIKEGSEIRVPLMEEKVNVEKQAVAREEVKIGKRQVRDTKRVTDTVRREEARLESDGEVDMAMSGASQGYAGPERREWTDPAYSGPERRLAGV